MHPPTSVAAWGLYPGGSIPGALSWGPALGIIIVFEAIRECSLYVQLSVAVQSVQPSSFICFGFPHLVC